MTLALKKQIDNPMTTTKLKITGYNPDKKFIVLSNNDGKKGCMWYKEFSDEFLELVQPQLIKDFVGIQQGKLDIPVTFAGTITEEDGYLRFEGKVQQ